MFAETELPGDEHEKWKITTTKEANNRWLKIYFRSKISRMWIHFYSTSVTFVSQWILFEKETFRFSNLQAKWANFVNTNETIACTCLLQFIRLCDTLQCVQRL